MVGPNVVFGLMPDQIGLIETIRVRQGRVPISLDELSFIYVAD